MFAGGSKSNQLLINGRVRLFSAKLDAGEARNGGPIRSLAGDTLQFEEPNTEEPQQQMFIRLSVSSKAAAFGQSKQKAGT